MSNQMTTINSSQLPAAIQQIMGTMQVSELSQNVGANFAVVSIRGKVFRIKFGGAETPIMMNFQGQQMAAPFLDVIMPMANGVLSKTYYKDAFSEGSDSQPDCWSEDGINPLAPIPQRPLRQVTGPDGVSVMNVPVNDCRTCPMNAFGSKVSPAGKPIKACADTRKVAVVPESNPSNETFGGPMLLRVPAASLAPLAEFDRALQGNGIPYFGVVVRIGFDQTTAYPKLTFTPLRGITADEAAIIVGLRSDPRTALVLASAQATAQAGPAPVTGAAFDPATGEIPNHQPVPGQTFATQQAPAQQAAPTQEQLHAAAVAQYEEQLRAQQAPPPAATFTPPPAATFTPPPAATFTPPPPAATFTPPPAANTFTPPPPAGTAAPQASAQGGAAPVATPGLLADVDSLLGM